MFSGLVHVFDGPSEAVTSANVLDSGEASVEVRLSRLLELLIQQCSHDAARVLSQEVSVVAAFLAH